MLDFGYIGNTNTGEFINLYSVDNPILDIDDIIYALIFNDIDYHYPLVVSGIINHYKITEGQNRIYYIQIQSINELPIIISKFIINKPFTVIPYKNNYVQTNKKKIQITTESDFSKFILPVEAFFCRNSEEKINVLKTEYLSVIKNDLIKMLNDINNL
jgi:hypothetical protein